MALVRRRGGRQHLAGRLAPIGIAVFIDEWLEPTAEFPLGKIR